MCEHEEQGRAAEAAEHSRGRLRCGGLASAEQARASLACLLLQHNRSQLLRRQQIREASSGRVWVWAALLKAAKRPPRSATAGARQGPQGPRSAAAPFTPKDSRAQQRRRIARSPTTTSYSLCGLARPTPAGAWARYPTRQRVPRTLSVGGAHLILQALQDWA